MTARSIPIDDVLPNAWSEKYHAAGSFLACIACGKRTSNKGRSQGVCISGGGSTIVHPEDYDTFPHNGGDMGWFPVGRECIRAVPAEFRADNPYPDPVNGV